MQGQYKLICIDLDGTLLGYHGTLSDYSIEVIRKAEEKGAIVCIASGRPFCQIVPYTTRIGLKTPVVACNGAHVFDPVKNEFWRREDLPVEESLKFLKFCDSHNFNWFIYGHYSINSPREEMQFAMLADFAKLYTNLGLPVPKKRLLKTEQDYIEALKEGAGKITARVDPEGMRIIEEYYKTPRPGTVCKKAASVLMETMNEKASKWDAIKVIADRLNIPDENICVFGDNMNDLEMIRECKTSFAMKNGDERIFKYATKVIGTNNEDGVAKAIEEYIMDNIIPSTQPIITRAHVNGMPE